jgi:hypothetical protein
VRPSEGERSVALPVLTGWDHRRRLVDVLRASTSSLVGMAFQVQGPGPGPASIKVQGLCIVEEANMKVAGSNLEYKVGKIKHEDKNKRQLTGNIRKHSVADGRATRLLVILERLSC